MGVSYEGAVMGELEAYIHGSRHTLVIRKHFITWFQDAYFQFNIENNSRCMVKGQCEVLYMFVICAYGTLKLANTWRTSLPSLFMFASVEIYQILLCQSSKISLVQSSKLDNQKLMQLVLLMCWISSRPRWFMLNAYSYELPWSRSLPCRRGKPKMRLHKVKQ